MKKLLFFCIMFAIDAYANAQDLLILKNGDELQVSVLEVFDTQIKYKKWDNPNGPTYTKNITDIFMIKYQNGSKDFFGNTAADQAAEPVQAVALPVVEAPATPVNTSVFEPQTEESYKGACFTFDINPFALRTKKNYFSSSIGAGLGYISERLYLGFGGDISVLYPKLTKSEQALALQAYLEGRYNFYYDEASDIYLGICGRYGVNSIYEGVNTSKGDYFYTGPFSSIGISLQVLDDQFVVLELASNGCSTVRVVGNSSKVVLDSPTRYSTIGLRFIKHFGF